MKIENKPTTNDTSPVMFGLTPSGAGELIAGLNLSETLQTFLQHLQLPNLVQLLNSFSDAAGKESFLVCKGNKYINVLTENIAFFSIKYDSSVLVCFDGREYFVKYSLEQIQGLISPKQFFRLNRQCLINFNAITEVEHYYARKLLVNPVVPVKDKIVVSKERVSDFLHWLDNR